MIKNGKSAYELVTNLDYERITGSEQEKRAADILTEKLNTMGIKAKRQTFEIPAYTIHRAELHITEPSCTYQFEVTGYGFSGSTPPEGIEAPFFYAENGEDVNLSLAKGCIVLLNTHPDAKVYKKMVESKVAGFIAISGSLCDDREKTDLEIRRLRKGRHLTEDNPVKLPGLSIRAQDAIVLLEQNPVRCRIILKQDEFTGLSQNIVAELPGRDHKEEYITDEYILFTAHYDSVPFSHGAYDNASGSAIIMELCRYFQQNPLKRPCRFIWCGAEEIGLVGSKHYVSQLSEEEKKRIALVINIDLAGQLIGAHHAVVSADECLSGIIAFLASESGYGVNIRQDVFPSDSSSFADVGIPAVSLYRTGCGGHSRNDTAGLMSAAALQKTFDFAKDLAVRLGNSAVFPVPHLIPKEIRQKLDSYFGRE